MIVQSKDLIPEEKYIQKEFPEEEKRLDLALTDTQEVELSHQNSEFKDDQKNEEIIEEKEQEEEVITEKEINHNEISDNIPQEKSEEKEPVPQVAEPEVKDDEEIETEEVKYEAPNPIHMFAEFNLEVERITMEMEDRASLQYEEFIHKQKFAQKDVEIPLGKDGVPSKLFLNEPVQPNPTVKEPVKDSFTKYMANQRPIDLSKVKFRVLWSKEKVAKEEEEKRIMKEKAKREKTK